MPKGITNETLPVSRHKYLIRTDYFSFFPEVLELKKNTKAPPPPLIIRELKDAFSRFGNPKGISDGGPQFTCKAFEISPNNGFSNTLSHLLHTPSQVVRLRLL